MGMNTHTRPATVSTHIFDPRKPADGTTHGQCRAESIAPFITARDTAYPAAAMPDECTCGGTPMTDPTTFEAELRQTFGDDDDGRATMRDLATYGASGGFPGLTYYTDTVALHDRHEAEIWDALYEDAEEQGVSILELIASFGGSKDVGSMVQLRNLLTWYMAERVARAEAEEEEN